MFRRFGDNKLSTMLNKRVDIWHSVVATERNELGQRAPEDTIYKIVYAGIIPQTGSLLSGREADTTLSRTTHKIIMRYDPTITSDMWVVADGIRYDILYIMDPYLNHERLELFVEVVV